MKWPVFTSTYWLDLFRRKKLAQDLDEEIRAHVAIDIQKRMTAGDPAGEARTAAMREIGSLDVVKENTRDAWSWTWLDRLTQDVRYALRGMRRNPGTTFVMLLMAVFGIGSTTAMFSVVNAVLLRPLSFNDSDRVVVIWESNPTRGVETFDVSPGNFWEWRRQNSVFKSMGAYQRRAVTLTGIGEAERVGGAYVSGEFFDVVQTPAHIGRTLSPKDVEQQSHVVVISQNLWRARYGSDASVLGRSMVLDGDSYSVAGVMPEDFMYPADTAVWVPFQPSSGGPPPDNLTVIARLKPDVTLPAAASQMKTIAARLDEDHPETNESWTTSVSYLQDDTVRNVRGSLLVLLGAVGFVFLIACTNIAGLLLVQGARRQREMAVRNALGAGPMRVLRQLLTESIVISLIGGVLGMGMAYALLHTLLGMVPGNLPRIHESEMSWVVLAFGVALTLATGVLFGVLPGIQLIRTSFNDQLKISPQSVNEGPRGRRLQSLLVVSQIALTIVVTSGAGLMAQSLSRLYTTDPGFNSENVLSLQVNLPARTYGDPERSISLMEQLLDRFHSVPGVVHAASTNALPLAGPALNEASPLVGFVVEGPIAERRAAQARFITPEYFQTLRIPILRGREFSALDRQNSPHVVIVNQSLARQAFHDEAPLGKRMQFGGVSHEIVGIVPDTRDEDLLLQPGPMYFLPFLQQFSNVSTLIAKVRFVIRVPEGVDLRALTAAVRNEIKSADSELAVFEVHTMKDIRRLSISRITFTTTVLILFSLVGLLLAAVGLYGIVSNSVSQRIREFGIRMALGAEPREILGSVMRQIVVLCGFGTTIGIIGSLALSRLMKGLVFEVSPHDPITLGCAVLILILVATGASLVPARRATRIDPIASLRHE